MAVTYLLNVKEADYNRDDIRILFPNLEPILLHLCYLWLFWDTLPGSFGSLLQQFQVPHQK
jgi:hypothetical protein